jgi:ribonuclease BN (tRNA processing enzyme)
MHSRVAKGTGSLLRFEQAGARSEDIEAILLTYLHVDHSADLPALVKPSFFSERSIELPVYGPTGNRRMPATGKDSQRVIDPGGLRFTAGPLVFADDRQCFSLPEKQD